MNEKTDWLTLIGADKINAFIDRWREDGKVSSAAIKLLELELENALGAEATRAIDRAREYRLAGFRKNHLEFRAAVDQV